MNIKEIKTNYERAAKIVVESMVQKGVNVSTSYNLEQGALYVNLVNQTQGQNQEPLAVIYNVAFVEETKAISISAVARHYMSDSLGLANVICEPIAIDESFMNNMKAGLSAALENYESIIAEDDAKKAETETKENESEETTENKESAEPSQE